MGRSKRLRAEEKAIKRNHEIRCCQVAGFETDSDVFQAYEENGLLVKEDDGRSLFGQKTIIIALATNNKKAARMTPNALACLIGLVREAQKKTPDFKLNKENFVDLASTAMRLNWELRALAEADIKAAQHKGFGKKKKINHQQPEGGKI